MNLWRLEPKSDIIHYKHQHGYVRKGDFIALALIVESYRQQFNHEYYLSLTPEHDGNCMWHWFQDYAYKGLPCANWDWAIITGDSWMFADRCHKQFGITPKVSNIPPKSHHVAVIPVMDAIYNCDRNWKLKSTVRLLDLIGKDALVVGTKKALQALVAVRPKVNYCFGTVRDAGDAVLSARLVIGGDTGFTHLASVADNGSPVISLQGYRGLWRATENFKTWEKHLYQAFYPWGEAADNECYFPKRCIGKGGFDVIMDPIGNMSGEQWEEIERCL